MSGPLQVGIGLVERAGKFLVRQRPPGSILAGVWEFPGGKCEPDESPAEAARRECREELGLDVEVLHLRRVVTHEYPHGMIELSFFDCALADPQAEPDQGSGFLWVAAEDLGRLTFPGANEAVLDELAREARDS